MTPAERTKCQLKLFGFDRCHVSGFTGVTVGCSQCEALVINGVACHEGGCPNKTRPCDECGSPVKRGNLCCQDINEDLL